jgi:hypothetical protein
MTKSNLNVKLLNFLPKDPDWDSKFPSFTEFLGPFEKLLTVPKIEQ